MQAKMANLLGALLVGSAVGSLLIGQWFGLVTGSVVAGLAAFAVYALLQARSQRRSKPEAA